MMKKDPNASPSELEAMIDRFYTAAELWTTGVALYRQAVRRRCPDASDADVDAEVQRWLEHRPGAEHGDGPRHPDR